MTVDLTKIELHTGYNAFKNVNRYTGSITFPTSIGAGLTATTTTTITLTDNAVFTQFFCNFRTTGDGLFGTGSAQWYSQNESGGSDVGVHRTAPSATYIPGLVYASVNGTTVTITAALFNGAVSTATFDSLTVPFSFIEYTLAS